MIDFGELLGELNILPKEEKLKPIAWPTYTRDTEGETYLRQIKEVCQHQPTILALAEALEALALVGVAADQVLRISQTREPFPISAGRYFIRIGRGDSMAEDREVRLQTYFARKATKKLATAENRLYGRTNTAQVVSSLHLGRELLEHRLHPSGSYVNYQPAPLLEGFRLISKTGENFGIPQDVARGISWAVGEQVFGKDYQPQTVKAYR